MAKHLMFGPQHVLATDRSFFGAYRVERQSLTVRDFMHGTTKHGSQYTDPDRWREPLSYYTRSGPLGQLFAALVGRPRVQTVGLVGLGVGSTLCYRLPGQTWWIFEIDPLVAKFAQDTRYFHYFEVCGEPAHTKMLYGDGRLLPGNAADGQFGLLILDAFSSDAIPVHLLTREAMALYFQKLDKDGVLVVHISNRHLDLSGVVGSAAAVSGMVALIQSDRRPRSEMGSFDDQSVWVAVARDRARLATLSADPRWAWLETAPDAEPWTDDYSNILGVLR